LQPGTRWLVSAPTYGDLLGVCFEGESGLINSIPRELVEVFNKSDVEIKLKNGSLIKGITAEKPERFRGPQFHGGWCMSPDTMIATLDGERRIDQIQIGDTVLTRFGPRRVLAAGKSNNKNDVVTIECGETRLTATVDHPILVGDRWLPAGEIKQGDLLCSAVLSTMASLGTSARVDISTTSGEDTCIVMSGSKPTVTFLTSTSSTIGTMAPPTMIWRIWSSCQSLSTNAIMELGGQPAMSSAISLLKRLKASVSRKMEPAFSALLGLFPRQLATSVDSALGNAGRFGAGTSLSSKNAIALFAAQHMSQSNAFSGIAAKSATTDQQSEPIELTKLAVKSVSRSPNIQTYNLTVEGEHEFIANGIVVHNCDELAAWQYADIAFDLLMFGMRLGNHPRLICTTTPKPNQIIRNLLAREGKDVSVTRATTYANLANLAPTFRDQILRYEGTTIGRQEIYAEVINPEEMGIIRQSQIKLWPHDRELPELEFIVMSLDTAFTEATGSTVRGDPDYSACVVWGVFSPKPGRRDVILLDCWQDRLGFPDLIKRTKAELQAVYAPQERSKFKPLIGPSYLENTGRKPDVLLIEDKGSGISLRQALGREGIMSAPYNPGRARKLDRLHAISPLFAAGRVWVVESDKQLGKPKSWAQPMIEQICTFSGEGSIAHDDLMDAAVQGLRYIADRDMIRVTRPEPEAPRQTRDDFEGNPYAI
jgi:predicted phage terminase large subunit-like protein